MIQLTSELAREDQRVLASLVSEYAEHATAVPTEWFGEHAAESLERLRKDGLAMKTATNYCDDDLWAPTSVGRAAEPVNRT